MKKTYLDTDKMYYGFPVFLLGYKDEAYGYNFTTVSSSYSLGDMMVVGIYKFGNALKQIKKFGCFTINLPDRSLMREIEIGGFCSGEDKFGLASNLNYFVSSQVDAPIIENCAINIKCEVVEIVELDGLGNYSNIFARIKGRLVNDNLHIDGAIARELINPVLYLGDGHKRSYRYTNDEINELGEFR